ncbi:MAG: transporter substrate-binding domain-containing protein [Tannerella sp.]|jgi:membrane-bound lytic murein transglycosylase MltF|nr:transporter substrate-binding domain-containing protein [Tannerella sp.]
MTLRAKIPIIFILLFIILTTLFLFYVEKLKTRVRDYGEIKKEGILKIVTEYNQSGYYVSGDSIVGFQNDLCEAIADISGLDVRIFPDMSISSSFEGLRKREYDVIARNIPVTSDNRQDFLFTDPILFSKQVLVQRTLAFNDSVPPVRNQLDLAQKTLCVPKNSPALLRIAHLQHEIGDTIYVVEEERYSSEQLIIMVAKGEIDYAVCDKQIAEVFENRFPEIDISTDISFMQLQSWVVRKESEVLLDSLNHWFKILRKNGIFDKIMRRYCKSDIIHSKIHINQ